MLMDKLKERLADYRPGAIDEQDYLQAAVLVPLVQYKGEDRLLFEVRGDGLRRQPGEISFPGGRIEKTDPSPEYAAVRECCEELGICRSDVEVLGSLDYLVSPIGVRLNAFAGRIHTCDFHVNAVEVAELFSVPLEYLLKLEPHKAIMQVATRPKENFPFEVMPDYDDEWRMRKTYPVYFYPYKQHQIWGLTARVLKNFLDIYRKIM